MECTDTVFTGSSSYNGTTVLNFKLDFGNCVDFNNPLSKSFKKWVEMQSRLTGFGYVME